MNSAEHPKPVRPYFWTLFHGGGGGWRWWREQPLADEEQRAMTADQPFFVMAEDDLKPLLRRKSEPVAAMVEGMALVKPLEYTLRHGIRSFTKHLIQSTAR